MKEKLKERLDVFSDAVIAIIITIMVLELPIKLINHQIDYFHLALSIGIYFVSFCFIANLWYQHAILFNDTKSIPNRIVILDILFLFLLSLIPTFTQVMTEETDKLSVSIYGIVCITITLTFNLIVKTLVENKYKTDDDLRKIYFSIYGKSLGNFIGIYFAILVVGFFLPKVSLVFYVIIPIYSFLNHGNESEEFQTITNMTKGGRDFFVNMSREDRIKYRSLILEYTKQIRKDPTTQPQAWEKFAKQVSKDFGISEDQLDQWNKINLQHQNHHSQGFVGHHKKQY